MGIILNMIWVFKITHWMTLIPSDGRLHYIWDKFDFVKLLSPMFGHISLRAWLELFCDSVEDVTFLLNHICSSPCVSGSHLFTDSGPANVLIHSHATSMRVACMFWLYMLTPNTSCSTVSREAHTEVTWIPSTHLCTSSKQHPSKFLPLKLYLHDSRKNKYCSTFDSQISRRPVLSWLK